MCVRVVYTYMLWLVANRSQVDAWCLCFCASLVCFCERLATGVGMLQYNTKSLFSNVYTNAMISVP